MNRNIVRSRRRRAFGMSNPSQLLSTYLSKFPRAIRREILSDRRKRILSMTAAKIRERTLLADHLNSIRAKLGVRFDDGTPEMPFLLPGMKWQDWQVEAKGTKTPILYSASETSEKQPLKLPALLAEMDGQFPRVEGWEEMPPVGCEL